MTTASTKYFQEHADQWDSLREGYFGEAVRESAIAKAYLRPEMEVADVGAGTGFMAAGLAPLVKRVHVIDGSPAMLEVARRNLGDFDNVVFHQAEGLSIPMPDASLDAVFANMYLHHCPDPQQAIREMVRLLRPGGRLMLTDMDAHSYEWMKEEMADEWMGFDRSQVRGWLSDADLVNVLVDCTGQSCCAESQNPDLVDPSGHSAKISVFLATGARRISGMRQAVQDQYGALAQGKGSCCSPSPAGTQSCCEGASEGKVSTPSEALPSNQGSCCGGDTSLVSQEDVSIMKPEDVHDPAQSASIPTEASEFSLGCGDPVAIASLQPGEVVLDIGSGGGLDVLLAAQKVGKSGKAIGVDMTQPMLERARRAAEQAGLEQVEFRFGHAEKLPVEDGEVDVVISNCVINLCEDKDLAFREAYRVLRKGGRLEVSDIVTDVALPLESRYGAQVWASCVSGALPEREYLDLIAQAGFRDVKTLHSADYANVSGVRVFSAHVSARK
jgi:ubiquinone/menaquinone biosynthesis C-methylase UbiE